MKKIIALTLFCSLYVYCQTNAHIKISCHEKLKALEEKEIPSAGECIEKLANGINSFKECTKCLSSEEYKRAILLLNKNSRETLIKSFSYEELEYFFTKFSIDEWNDFYNKLNLEERKLVPQNAAQLDSLKPGLLKQISNSDNFAKVAAISMGCLVIGGGLMIGGGVIALVIVDQLKKNNTPVPTK